MRLLTGVVGIGKSTVADGLRRDGLKVTNLGTLMFEIASAQGLVKARDELRELAPATREQLRFAALRRIAPNEVVDVHLSVRTHGVLEPSFPDESWRNVTHCILLEARPDSILRRRAVRTGRNDEPDTQTEVAEQQVFNRQIANAAASRGGTRVAIVDADQPVGNVIRQALAALRAG